MRRASTRLTYGTEQITEILTEAFIYSFSVDASGATCNVCAPPSGRISVRSPSQPETLLHKVIFSELLPMSQKREVSWSTDVNWESSHTGRPKAMPFSTSTSSDAGRDPVAGAAARQVAGGGPDEFSPRSVWESKAGSYSAQGSSSHIAEGHPTRRNSCPPSTNTQLWDATTKYLMRSLGTNDLRNGSCQRGSVVRKTRC